MSRLCGRSGHWKNQPLCGMDGLIPVPEPAPAQCATAANTGTDNPPAAKCCAFEPGTPEWRPVFCAPDAFVPTDAPDRKARSQATDQRLLLTLRLWSGIESRLVADTLLRAGQAADRVPIRSPPVHRKIPPNVLPPPTDRAADWRATPKSSAHTADTSNAAPQNAANPPGWRNARSSHADAAAQSTGADTADARS